MARKSLRNFFRIFLAGFAAIFLALLLLPLLPPVSDFVIAKVFAAVTATIQDATGLKASYSGASFHPYNRISLSGLSLSLPEGQDSRELGSDEAGPAGSGGAGSEAIGSMDEGQGSGGQGAPLLTLSTLDVRFNLFKLAFGPREEGVEAISAGRISAAFSRGEAQALAKRLADFLERQPASETLPALSLSAESLSVYVAASSLTNPAITAEAAIPPPPGDQASPGAASPEEPSAVSTGMGTVGEGFSLDLEVLLPEYSFSFDSRDLAVSTKDKNYTLSFSEILLRSQRREGSAFVLPLLPSKPAASASVLEIQRFAESLISFLSSPGSDKPSPGSALKPSISAVRVPGSSSQANKPAVSDNANTNPATSATSSAGSKAGAAAKSEAPVSSISGSIVSGQPDDSPFQSSASWAESLSSALSYIDFSGLSLSLRDFSATLPQDFSNGEIETLVAIRKHNGFSLDLPVSVSLGQKSLRVGVTGEGYRGNVEVKGGEVAGEVGFEGYGVGGVVGKVVQEAMGEEAYGVVKGLRVWGEVRGGYGAGGVRYEGEVRGVVGEGATVGGVGIGGWEGGLKGKGDGEGMEGQAWVKGGGYEVGYEGKVGYGEYGVEGEVRVRGTGVEVAGKVEGGRGEYGYRGEGVIGGIEAQEVGVRYRGEGGRYEVGVQVGLTGGRIEVEGRGEGGVNEWMGRVTGIGGREIGGVWGVVGGEVPGWVGGIGEVGGQVVVRERGGEVSWVVRDVGVKGTLGGVGYGIAGSGKGEGGRYEVRGVELRYGQEVVTVGGEGAYGEGEVGFKGTLGVGGMGYEVGLRVRGGVVEVEGGYGLKGRVEVKGGEVAGDVTVVGLPYGIGEGVAYGYGRVRGKLGGGVYEAVGEGVRVRYEGKGEVYEGGVEGSLRVAGKVGGEGGIKAQGVWVKAGGVEGRGDVTVGYGEKGLAVQARGEGEGIGRIEATGEYRKGDIRGELSVNGAELEKLQIEGLSGTANAKIVMSGGMGKVLEEFSLETMFEELNLAFEGDLQSAEYQDQALRGKFFGVLGAGTLALDLPEALYGRLGIMGTSIRLNMRDKTASLSTSAALSLDQGVLSGKIDMSGRYSKHENSNPDALWYQEYGIEFAGNAKNVKYLETSVSQWEFSGKYDDGVIEFIGGKDNVKIYRTADGKFEIGLSNALPVSGKVRGVINGNEISASMEDIDIKLRELASLVPMRGFQILGGRLFGDLNISGSLSDPEFEGSLQLSGATVLSKELIVGTIGPVSSNLVISGRNAELMPTFVPFEKGGVQLSATCLLDRWNITDLNAKLISTADSVVTISTKIAGITINETKAKVDMALSFENETIILDGSAFLDNGQVAIDPQGFLPENMPVEPDPVMYRLRLNMNFGKQLEVYLPDTNLPLVRGFTSPTSSLYLQFDSQSQEFSLDGTIDLRSGYVLYYLRNFFLKSGKIDFSENSTKFNPLITATAELRESGPSGPVRITLNAEKSPLENLNPRLSSIPFYTETELISLMSGRVLAADTSSALDIREAAIATSEFIPQLNIFKTFERNVQKALGVDIVYIRSSFMQRWLLDLTKPVTEANPEDPLARYLDQSELYIGKYLTDSAFLHASLRFREDPLVSATRLRLDSEFGIEFDSPFGLINWSITPSLDEGSLVTGQELSLSWRYIY